MAITLEQVEKLRGKSGATYEACKKALEHTEGDLLEALIYLEQQGKSATTGGCGFYTTQPGGGKANPADLVLSDLPPHGKKHRREPSDWRAGVGELWDVVCNLLRHSTQNRLEVWRAGQLLTDLPVLILIALIVVAFWITVPLLMIGLICGCRYQFAGPDVGKQSVNHVMNTVTKTVGGVVDEVKREFQKKK